MKRGIQYLVPILLLLGFVFIMNGTPYFKQPKGETEDVAKYIKTVISDIEKDNWTAARDDARKLETAWSKVVPRIQFSAELDEIHAININIARLLSFIMSKDKTGALSEISEVGRNWEALDE